MQSFYDFSTIIKVNQQPFQRSKCSIILIHTNITSPSQQSCSTVSLLLVLFNKSSFLQFLQAGPGLLKVNL